MVSEQTDASGLAGRYATALFQLGVENSSIDIIDQELTQIKLMIDQSTDLRRVLRSPLFTSEEQSRAMAALCKEANFSLFVSNLIGVLSGNRRLFALEGIIAEFSKLLSEFRGEVEAEIITAVELTDKQKNVIKDQLKSIIGEKLSLNFYIDQCNYQIILVVRVACNYFDY